MICMTLINSVFEKVTSKNKKIVLPEIEDSRVRAAAKIIKEKNLANPVFVYDDSTDISILDELKDFDLIKIDDRFSKLLFEKRKHKGLTENEALKLSKNPVYFSTMLLESGYVDGLVSGAIHSTADTLRPALQIIKTKDGVKLASSFFIMVLPDDEVYFFSDCGFNINPTSEELVEIAIQTANSVKSFGIDPRVAFLSFSTKGSASGNEVSKVVDAVTLLKSHSVDFIFDGELQLDAAIIPEVAKLKSPNSELKGSANVLIFPNLDSGNIGYKLVQRLAGAKAIGPIVQGLKKPVNDLSRGCSVEDIVEVVAITALESLRNDLN